MIDDPAYYRDLLDKILTEDEDDDIPLPPSREDLKKIQKQRAWMAAHPTEQDKVNAILRNSWDFPMVVNPSEAVQTAYVKKTPWGIENITDPSEAVQLAAVRSAGTAIAHIKNPSDAVKKAAVENSGYALKDIPNPSPELVKIAIKTSPEIILNMDQVTPKMKEFAAKSLAAKFPRKVFKPGQNFHKMLRYINDVPGDARSGWYKRGLGNNPEGLPGFSGDKALDGVATLMGLITHRDPGRKDSTYQLRITDKGRRVLAKLDQGEKLTLADVAAV